MKMRTAIGILLAACSALVWVGPASAATDIDTYVKGLKKRASGPQSSPTTLKKTPCVCTSGTYANRAGYVDFSDLIVGGTNHIFYGYCGVVNFDEVSGALTTTQSCDGTWTALPR